MTCGMSHAGKSGQFMVNQTPRFENAGRKRKRKNYRPNQVIGKSGLIRPDKRARGRYF